MADVNDVTTAFRQELVTAGLVRRPSTAGSLPPMHVEPVEGAPAPGEREAPEDDATLAVTLRLSGELGEAPFDSYRRRVVLDVRYRSKTTAGLKRARVLDAAIRQRIVNRPDYGLGWIMGGTVLVLSSTLFAGLGPIGSDPAQGYDELAKYALEVQTS